MQAVTEQVKRIQIKLQDFAKKYNASVKEIEQQQKTIASLQKKQEADEKRIKGLEEQQYILKSAAGKMNEPDKKRFEQLIGKYVREIDNCIDLLSE